MLTSYCFRSQMEYSSNCFYDLLEYSVLNWESDECERRRAGSERMMFSCCLLSIVLFPKFIVFPVKAYGLGMM